jgi:poly(A) polymerase Pap1
MGIDCTINIIDLLALIVTIIIAILGSSIFKKISSKEKYDHEQEIIKKIGEDLSFGRGVILADVEKYHTKRTDDTNSSYYKQGAEFYNIVPEYGVQFILHPSDEKIPIALVPFEWIKYIRDYDSEDNKIIIVSKFNGIKYYKNFKSPFKEIEYYKLNPSYDSSQPDIFRYIK